ncbi:aminoglycoside phosphotransferase family protein [Thermomonospora umbrina]|uniref:Streptomycin 6-kinase n=1 Tax=Thermomonospora umbrina TaxID=111806 RepID=A0A3D9SUA2_9ACTN|nr:aminoglycoside phosphotransferase family protein [Thermomonospora umbrina]REE96565.1 streptomycin 6-kinase [Thermomonospora umbrina]
MIHRIEAPDALADHHADHSGDEGKAWIAALPDLAESFLDRWDLTPDGPTRHGFVALVVPVLRADGTPAALKLQPSTEDTVGEPVGLRTWDGRGAVRLLDHDAGTGTMLLERLDGDRSLASVPDDAQALRILTELLARLVAVPAPPGLRTLKDIAEAMLADVPEAVTALPSEDDRRLLRTCAAALREVVGEPGDRLLHWDLHYENVLAGEREPWLAIDPQPLVGDPCFELLPALDNRWDEVVATGDVHRAVRRRFDLMTEILDLDRERAVAWTLGRVLQNLLWEIEDEEPELSAVQIAVAEALLRPRVHLP